MHFSKYHGAQNDFIVVAQSQPLTLSVSQIRWLCDRHRGIGADGVVWLQLHDSSAQMHLSAQMHIFNADGSRPEMCGNAFRCVVKHMIDRGLVPVRDTIEVQTDAGLLTAQYTKDSQGKVDTVTVDMGAPRTPVTPLTIEIDGRPFLGHTVSMGNPHFVIESETPAQDAQSFGARVSTHQAFAKGVNAEFVHMGESESDAVIYERGAGLTMACGTGACAIVAVGQHLGKLKGTSHRVRLPGGVLTIHRGAADHLLMTGEAAWAFDGDVDVASVH